LAFAATTASAQDASYGVGVGLSTFGPTLEGTYKIQPGINMRGIVYIPLSAEFTDSEVTDDYDITGEANTGAFALMGDYYPTGQGWRISGGLFFAPDEIVSGTFDDNMGTSFSGSLQMENEVAPIIAGGYQYDFNNNMYVSGEIGAIFSGFSATTTSTDAAVLSDVADINDELDDLPAYPYIAVTVGFSF